MLFFLAPFVPDVYPVLYDLSVIIAGLEVVMRDQLIVQ